MGSNRGPFWTRDREKSKVRGISPAKTLCSKAQTHELFEELSNFKTPITTSVPKLHFWQLLK